MDVRQNQRNQEIGQAEVKSADCRLETPGFPSKTPVRGLAKKARMWAAAAFMALWATHTIMQPASVDRSQIAYGADVQLINGSGFEANLVDDIIDIIEQIINPNGDGGSGGTGGTNP